jgi:hypothetical protein
VVPCAPRRLCASRHRSITRGNIAPRLLAIVLTLVIATISKNVSVGGEQPQSPMASRSSAVGSGVLVRVDVVKPRLRALPAESVQPVVSTPTAVATSSRTSLAGVGRQLTSFEILLQRRRRRRL